MDDIFNTIKMGNPVKLFNFDAKNNPVETIIGLYLNICLLNDNADKIKNALEPKIVIDDMTDDSLLIFDKRHIYEVCLILNAVLDGFKKNKYIINKDLIKKIFNITSECITYAEFKSIILKLISEYKDTLPEPIYNNFKIMMGYIWFIPYNGFIEIYTDAEKLYKKEKGIKDETDN